MKISIADKIVYTKVMKKEVAQQKYDDAVAQGNTAAMINEKEVEGQQLHQLDIGNILPGQTISVEINIRVNIRASKK